MWTFPVLDLPPDPRRALPIFQLAPNWKNGVTEVLSWLTDVMSSETAVEQRRSLRRFPRRSFEYEYLRQGTAQARIKNFLAGVGKRDCLVPIWHEQYTLPATGAGVVFPLGTLGMREFGVNDLVLLTTLNQDRYAVLTVTDVDLSNDLIELAGVDDVGAWPLGSRIVPLRRAKVLDSTQVENVTDRVAVARIRFMLQDADERFAPSWGYCSPLWRIKPDRKTPLRIDHARSDYRLDFDTGVVDITDPGDRAQIMQSMAVKLFGREQVWGFRSFLYNARGRARRFYVPTYTNDVELAEDIPGGLEFDAKPNGFSEYFSSPQDARTMIGIEFKDGRPQVFRTVVGVAALPGTVPPFNPVAERFVVDTELPPMTTRDVERIQFITPSRLDQDSIELFHATADSAAVSASVVVRSSTLDGMPPIECWVTSRPYPVVATESLQSDARFVSGNPTPFIIDGLASEGLPVGGTLEQVIRYSTYDRNPPESLETDVAFLTGTLEQVIRYSTYDRNPPESLATNTLFVGGNIRVALITFIADTDSIQTTATFTGGTLS